MNDDNHDDDPLWQAFTQDIDPIEKEKPLIVPPAKKQGHYTNKPLKNIDTQPSLKLGTESLESPLPQLDRRTDEKLKRGKMLLEGRLDLHGMTQDKAIIMLSRFIETSYNQGKRTVLVITGKGSLERPSVLRQNVPEWLARDEYHDIVLKVVSAQPKDGGSGAYYVYLKRHRS